MCVGAAHLPRHHEVVVEHERSHHARVLAVELLARHHHAHMHRYDEFDLLVALDADKGASVRAAMRHKANFKYRFNLFWLKNLFSLRKIKISENFLRNKLPIGFC